MHKREYAVLAVGQALVSEDKLGDAWILVTGDKAVEHAKVPERVTTGVGASGGAVQFGLDVVE